MSSTKEYDAIILGAGISGLVSASILLGKGNKRILLVDEFDHLGGNHIDVRIGDYSFDIGSFFFQDDSPLLNHFPELLPYYLPGKYSTSRITPGGILAKYPIDPRKDILAAGPLVLLGDFMSLIAGRLTNDRDKNALEFVKYWIGARLAKRTGLVAYLTRFYGVSPESIEADFARKRMGWPCKCQLERYSSKLRPRQAGGPPNQELVRPREGFNYLYQSAADSLSARGVTIILGAKIGSISKTDAGSLVVKFDGQTAESKTLISTIPVGQCLSLCNLPPAKMLETVDLTSLFYSFEGERGFEQNVLYNFSEQGLWKRLTVHSDFYGRSNGREYFSVEAIDKRSGNDAAVVDRDFIRHAKENRIFAGDLRLEGTRFTKNVYPVYLAGATADASDALARLREFGVLSFGRQGGFDYQPTARASTNIAESILN